MVAYGFGGLRLWLDGPVASGPAVRQCILVGVGGSGIERERGRDWRPTVPFEGMIQ
jgi:hypothetical protein